MNKLSTFKNCGLRLLMILPISFLGLSNLKSQTFTELVFPKYLGSKTAASTNNARTPVAFCFRIDGLTPSAAYDIQAQLGLTTDAATSYGAGNIWSGTAFSGSKVTNAFTTNASGSSGPVWIYIQPTGNATRFGAGLVHNLRVGYVETGGTMPAAPNFVSTKTITALDIAATALTTETTDDGAFLAGTALTAATGKYVLLFDNTAGTGDPLFAYQIRQTIATNTTQSELPTVVNDIYMQAGTSVIGSYTAVIPIGANNPNGVRRIESRNADNSLFGVKTDADGIWQSGANSTTVLRRDVVIITSTDAPLAPVTALQPYMDHSNLTVYPNPSTDKIYTKNSNNELIEITILSSLGKPLKSVQSEQGIIEVDLSDLPKGMYIVKMMNLSNKYSEASKVILK